MFGLQSVCSFFIACTADNESLYNDISLLLLTLSLFSESHNKASFIAVSSAVKIVILSVNLTPHLKSNSEIQKAADVIPSRRVCVYMKV